MKNILRTEENNPNAINQNLNYLKTEDFEPIKTEISRRPKSRNILVNI